MMPSVLDAVSAYKKSDALPGIAPIGGAKPGGEGSFGDILQQVAGDTVEDLKKAEKMTRQGVAGSANPIEIATAVAGAETSLQMLATLREKVIQAYQEITRMSV